MDEISISKEFERTGKLLEKMSNDDFVESANPRIGIFGNHIPSVTVVS
jgi:hypothetical protein